MKPQYTVRRPEGHREFRGIPAKFESRGCLANARIHDPHVNEGLALVFVDNPFPGVASHNLHFTKLKLRTAHGVSIERIHSMVRHIDDLTL